MNQKGFSQLILLVIVGVVIAVAGGGFYYQQSAKQNKSAPGTQVIPESPSAPAEQTKQKTPTIPTPTTTQSPPKKATPKPSPALAPSLPIPTQKTFKGLPSLLEAEVANDVTAEDTDFVIRGISEMDFYLQKWFGKSINQPTVLSVNAIESNSPMTGASTMVKNGKLVISIGTRNVSYKQDTQLNKEKGGEWRPHISAHEYVHAYQFDNGCGALFSPITPRWFKEGEAEWLSYKAMKEAGLLPLFSIQQMILPDAKQVSGSLQSLEKDWMNFSTYPLFTVAIDYLMKDRPIKTLDDFCVNLANGKGMGIPKAFETAFGISLDKFYEEFESYRKTWPSGGALPSGGGNQSQIPQVDFLKGYSSWEEFCKAKPEDCANFKP